MIKTFEWKKDCFHVLDQKLLPGKIKYIPCRTFDHVWATIRDMNVRGAPAIGVAAGFGLYLGMLPVKIQTWSSFEKTLLRFSKRMNTARPTASNLAYATELIVKRSLLTARSFASVAQWKSCVLSEALRFEQEDIALCEGIGRSGASLIKQGSGVLTHCNAGALATAGIGTALAVIYVAARKRKFRVYATETRPFMQGARLTSWELQQNGLDPTLICDNMVGHMMRSGKIDMVVVGADRIARNGDAANKIGTYMLACVAKDNKIPFYIAAPATTFDPSVKDGSGIPIEERNPREIGDHLKSGVIPKGMRCFNPAFDVTPARLITGFITDRGLLKAPFLKSLKKLI